MRERAKVLRFPTSHRLVKFSKGEKVWWSIQEHHKDPKGSGGKVWLTVGEFDNEVEALEAFKFIKLPIVEEVIEEV